MQHIAAYFCDWGLLGNLRRRICEYFGKEDVFMGRLLRCRGVTFRYFAQNNLVMAESEHGEARQLKNHDADLQVAGHLYQG